MIIEWNKEDSDDPHSSGWRVCIDETEEEQEKILRALSKMTKSKRKVMNENMIISLMGKLQRRKEIRNCSINHLYPARMATLGPVLESAKFIYENSEHVTIPLDGVNETAKKVNCGLSSLIHCISPSRFLFFFLWHSYPNSISTHFLPLELFSNF